MAEQIETVIESKNKLFLKNKKYILENDWSFSYTTAIDKTKKNDKEDYKALKESIKYKQSEFKLQNDISVGMLQHISRFLKKIKGTDVTEKIQEFLDNSLEIIELHTDRVDSYIDNIDISEIDNMEIRSDELQFHNDISKEVELIQDKITLLGLRNSKVADTSEIAFLNDAKAPLSMHWALSEIYPEINKKLEEKGVDLDAPATNDEMLIYMSDVPKWDTKLHYWEQKTETLLFYASEFQKLKHGIVIDGYYISGWMYYHINVFVTPIPHKIFNEKSKQFESKDKIINPPLRDSDVLVFENYENSKRKNILFTFLAATRRAAKTTLESSKLGHAATIGKKELLCAGGSTKDLNQIAKNFRTDIQYKNSAFAVYNVANDWKDKVEMGLKTKAAKTIVLSTLYIVNTDSGNNVEILAGFTPDEFVYDEVLKGKFIEALQGLKPALKGTDGLIRCFGLLSATGGDEELSRDGFIVLKDPESNNVLPMDWNLLERGVPEECITWKEDKNKPFGTFIPGQMCVDMPKFESNLAKYVGKENSPNLEKIKIKVTDWVNATNTIKENRLKLKGNKIALTKETVYIPIKPSEIFLSGKTNPFPYEVATAHLERIRLEGRTGMKVDLVRKGNEIETPFSIKDTPNFPFEGGFFDSPVVVFGGVPEEKPPRGLYCMALDDYKQEQSGTDSLGCFIVYKRQAGNDEWGDKIAAIYTSRPDPHRKFHMWGHMLAEKYNVEEAVLMENEDMEFKVYLDGIKQTERYLVPTFNMSADLSVKSNGRRQYGISPQGNKSAIINKAINYCNEIIIINNEDGTASQKLGVENIDDEMLLEEIINYKEGENHDRITTFGIALIQAHKMDAEYVPVRLTEKKVEEQNKKPHVKRIFGGNRGRGILR